MSSDLPRDGDLATNGDANGTLHDTPTIATATEPASTTAPVSKDVETVMYSDIGINTLLNRLKQSIASSRDFSDFLKKRGAVEEDHAKGLRRLVKQTSDNIHSKESRQGSYVVRLDEAMRLHDRIADNGMQFSLALHQMHEDLNELSLNMEKGRKHWKHEGLNAEKRATDAEAAMEKAKAKYDGLAEDYDRARTGDAKSSRRIGLKGMKSAPQHEEDLLRKLQVADSDYQAKVQAAKSQREELIRASRPQAVKALQELINECDSGLALQLQKFASFNEKLLLGNGIAVSPLPASDPSAPVQHSLRDIVLDIDNKTDFDNYVTGHVSKIPVRTSDIKYEQHPTLRPKQQTPVPASRQPSTTVSGPALPETPLSTVSTQQSTYPTVAPPPAATQSPTQPFYGNPGNPPYPTDPPQQYNSAPYPTSSGAPRGFSASTQSTSAPYSPATPATMGVQQSFSSQPRPISPAPTATALPPPLKPVFGVNLDDLYARDQTAVPMIVYQCMQAVDLFGLDVEGIYRLSGTASHVQQIKALFDHDSSLVDFRNPAAFYHDVNSVAGLLKQFFRELPDPLLTRRSYNGFINAARIDDDTSRRDAVHSVINELPDPNYATLRAVVLHLNRVQEHYAKNRMSTSNLAICFAPSLMGSHTGPQIADASLQARVLDTILTNTFQIFDED
ncbi:RhoGAP-domain-containing protein [Aureobasidium pullulans]|nr:RhoGAP-domain-containing protein [Aureobasidium pullulans]THZ72437.1 RhoGAP-domain-containing protein [Aureobasidium pullulans]